MERALTQIPATFSSYDSNCYFLVNKMDYNIAVRRDGRAVECTGLENQQALIGLPGFESLSLRHYN
jgi:hypothetical protein